MGIHVRMKLAISIHLSANCKPRLDREMEMETLRRWHNYSYFSWRKDFRLNQSEAEKYYFKLCNYLLRIRNFHHILILQYKFQHVLLGICYLISTLEHYGQPKFPAAAKEWGGKYSKQRWQISKKQGVHWLQVSHATFCLQFWNL